MHGMLATLLLGAHLYVAPTGQDSNPGTAAAPFATIARAALDATPGTVVHVAPGVYEGGFRTDASGSAAGRITYRSTVRWGARIVPADGPRAASKKAWDNRGDDVDIVGFEVDGSRYRGGVKWTIGIYSGGSRDAIEDNHVHHVATDAPCTSAGGAGIGIDGYYRGAQSDVTGNSVHDIGPAGCRFMQGIYVSTTGTVRNNVVYRIAEAGIHLWHDASHVVIANNTVTTSNTGILVGGGDFYYTRGPNDHTDVFSNIVYDNRRGIVEQGFTGKNNRYRNNLVYGNWARDWQLRNGLCHHGTIAAPPRFVAYTRAGTPDFRLAPGSPALGKGPASAPAPADDLGATR